MQDEETYLTEEELENLGGERIDGSGFEGEIPEDGETL